MTLSLEHVRDTRDDLQLTVQGLLLEKLKPLDAKLKYQIEKLLKMANESAGEDVKSALKHIDPKLRHAPNLSSFKKEKKKKTAGSEDEDEGEGNFFFFAFHFFFSEKSKRLI